MSYEAKPGTFSLFKNDRKESETHPDYKGDGADLYGNPVWVNAWLKKTKDGKTYMSCAIKLKEPRPETGRERQQRKAEAPKPAAEFDDSEIPF